VAQFTGMTVIGNAVGYLWAALIVAWIYHENYRKSFVMSFLVLLSANLIYYPILAIFHLFNITFAPPPLHLLRSFVYWTIISAIICLLASIAVWMARYVKLKLLNYGIFLIAYIGMIGVMLWENRMFAINWGRITMIVSIQAQTFQAIGYLYELVFGLVVTTIILSVGLKTVVKKSKSDNNNNFFRHNM